MLARVFLQPGDEVILPQPSFLMYEIMARAADAVPTQGAPAGLDIDLDAVAACGHPGHAHDLSVQPQQPHRHHFPTPRSVRTLSRPPAAGRSSWCSTRPTSSSPRDPDCPRGIDYLESGRPVATLRTFSKAYGLAGLRIGYGVMPAEMADLLHRVRQPFNAGSLAQVGALAALEDDDFLEQTVTLVHEGLAYSAIRPGPARPAMVSDPGQFFSDRRGDDADVVFEKMLRQGVIVRSMTAYGYPEFIRINVGLPEENERFVRALGGRIDVKRLLITIDGPAGAGQDHRQPIAGRQAGLHLRRHRCPLPGGRPGGPAMPD